MKLLACYVTILNTLKENLLIMKLPNGIIHTTLLLSTNYYYTQ